MSLPSVQNQDRVLLRDCTILGGTGSSSLGASIGFLGQALSVKITLRREYADVTAAADQFSSRRAIRWGEGVIEISGFSQLTGSRFAALFIQGSFAVIQIQESSTGDSWQCICCLAEFDKELGHDATKDRLHLIQVGIPQFGAGGSSPVNIPLDPA